MVTGVAIRMEPTGETLQKGSRVLRLPGRPVLVQHNGMFRIPACPVQPHITLAPSCPALQFQHLQRGLVRVEHLPLEEPPVQFLIYRFQPVLRHPQHPVAHGLPAQLHACPVPLLFLPVQRCVHHKFLHHDVGDRIRRGIAAWDQGGELFRLADRRLRPFLLAFWAGIGEVDVFPDLHLGRNHHQCAPDVPSNLHHGSAAHRTVQLVLRDTVFLHLNRYIVRQDLLQSGGTPGMGSHLRLLGPPFGHPGLRLHQLFFQPLRRRPIELVPAQAHLFQEPVQLLVQLVSFRFQ